jgi:hypothetical protein
MLSQQRSAPNLKARCFGKALLTALCREGKELNRWDLDIEQSQGSIVQVQARTLRGEAFLHQLIRQGRAVLTAGKASE